MPGDAIRLRGNKKALLGVRYFSKAGVGFLGISKWSTIALWQGEYSVPQSLPSSGNRSGRVVPWKLVAG
jgi:hypothetical protein